MPDYQSLVSQALAGSRLSWIEETRRRLLVVLGNGTEVQKKSTLDLWLTYLTALGYTIGAVAERVEKWAPGYSTNYAALQINTTFSITQAPFSGSSANPVSTTPVVVGGLAPRVFALGGDALPAGLSFSTVTGQISGTMSVPAPTTLNFTIQVTDAVGRVAGPQAFTVTLT